VSFRERANGHDSEEKPVSEQQPTPPAPARGGQSQATQLVNIARDTVFFHTPEGEAWATIPVGDHREHWPLKVKAFRRWLARRFYEQEKKTPSAQAL
jgi:hypothetical protein